MMIEIIEKVQTSASPEKVYNIWAIKYLNVQENENNYVIDQNKKRVKFKIIEKKHNKSLTILWYSFFMKLYFEYNVDPITSGSLITCKVKFKSFLSFLIRPFIVDKIKTNLKTSLTQFSKNLTL